jgi:DNA polymerase-3 subunit alpha (Gram-positive type)
MFPKSHAAAYMIAALRLCWFKVYHPIAFYCSWFTVKGDAFDAEVAQSRSAVKKAIKVLEAEPNLVAKDKETLSVLLLIREMQERGFEFLPVDVFKSKPKVFVPEDGKIRLPLISLKGLGETAALNIHAAISSGAATTLEELQTEASLSKTVVEILVNNNCLGGLPLSNQITLF